MKAEHRKELETNALAEGVGGLVRKMRTGRPQKRTYTYIAIAVVAFVVLWFVSRFYQLRADNNAEAWARLELGTRNQIEKLVVDQPDTNPGRAALLDQAYIRFWETGIKMLGNPLSQLKAEWSPIRALDDAYGLYERVKNESPGDPIFEPEAMFGMAAIEETRAALDRGHLNKAKDLYKELVGKHESSAYGKLAKERLKALEDPRSRNEIMQFYSEMRVALNLREPDLPRGGIAPRAKPAPKQKEEGPFPGE